MISEQSLTVHNGEVFSLADAGERTADDFRNEVVHAIAAGGRIASLNARPRDGSRFNLTAVLARDAESVLQIVSTTVEREYESLTSDCPQAHWFEREIFEQCGLRPLGHPWLKPIRFPGTGPFFGEKTQFADKPSPENMDLSPSRLQRDRGAIDFFQMEGEEVHEVAVGPVHAGIIEPGHFRFQCHGETVFHLEISLGYQHRGIERALVGGPNPRSIHYLETAAGDTSIGHATAYCHAVESLSQTHVPLRAQVIRGIALELERIANHIGDLGALGRGRGIFADDVLLRTDSRRRAQYDRDYLRQSVRT